MHRDCGLHVADGRTDAAQSCGGTIHYTRRHFQGKTHFRIIYTQFSIFQAILLVMLYLTYFCFHSLLPNLAQLELKELLIQPLTKNTKQN